MEKSKCCGAERGLHEFNKDLCSLCGKPFELLNNPMTQTDEEIKKDREIDGWNAIVKELRDRMVVKNDSFDYFLQCQVIPPKAFMNLFPTLQEEYKKELIEKIEKIEPQSDYSKDQWYAVKKYREDIINIIKQ